jgi:heme/copper-type cytochrome/quinol oxidase subunit 2
MSAYHQHQQPYLQPQHQDDVKASFDDLIDQYSSPYAPNSQHQTFTVGKPLSQQQPLSHMRRPSTSKEYSTKSDDTHDTSAYNYPPPLVPKEEKDTDKETFWQRLVPESMACRLYVATVLLETTINLAIEGELFLRVREKIKSDNAITPGDPNASTSRMPVYLSVFALAHVFQFVMAVDAVYARNTLQFLFLTLLNTVFLLYSVLQISEIQEAMVSADPGGTSSVPINVLTTAIPIVIAIAEIAYIALGWKIYHEFGWKVYKFLGADRQVKRMYAVYQIYECLIKFDVFFWAGFSVQFIWLVLQDTQVEYYITCAALPFSIVLLVEGHLAARYENKWMMATFMLGCIGAMVYFVYKLVQVLLHKTEPQYKELWKSLSVFSVISIVLLFTTFLYSVLVLRNFGRGLKEALARKAMGGQNHQRKASRNLNRMSIE